MSSGDLSRVLRLVWRQATLLLALATLSHASATLLLEEPYGHLGFFTATGHAAVYLPGVCAETPVQLRKCAPGEMGVVISRYSGLKYDWIAIPLIPYLYAVERPDEIPLFADARLVLFLRDRYRRRYLEQISPDRPDGRVPGGNWYELIGSAYDRTTYGFEIETSPEMDEALIRKLNSTPNRSHFHTVSRNCADFAKDIINFYYPATLHRSIVADVGITTPKQLAKLLVKFGQNHPEIQHSRWVIEQVPGSMHQSFTVHGVVESFSKSKKYIVPTAVASPIFAGCVLGVFLGTGASRFQPARDALVFHPGSSPEPPLGREALHRDRNQLSSFLAEAYPSSARRRPDKVWSKLQANAKVETDDQEGLIFYIQMDGRWVRMGASADNVLESGAPPQLARALLEAHIESELHHRSPNGISESDLARDWKLLEQTLGGTSLPLAASAPPAAPIGVNGR